MSDLELARHLQREGIRDERVLAAIARLDRADFVPPAQRARAGRDTALEIGLSQTISQPYVVALMTQALQLRGDERVLEVGTGSGYQTAVLAQLCAEVFSVEVLAPLHRLAEERLRQLPNVHLALGDGRRGWPEEAPFDGILVAAASPEVPEALLEQLAPGGALVLPVGPYEGEQELVRIVRHPRTGELSWEPLLPVRFVPLVRTGPGFLA